MFVLCPHCHFLVGVDPRTGKPPALCPKCGNAVVESVPAPSEEAAPPAATPLDPFAQVELPSLAPQPSAEAEALPEPEALPAAPSPPTKPARKPRSWFKAKAEPVPEPTPAPAAKSASIAAPQPAAPGPDRADAMIAALMSRKPSRKKAAPPPPSAEPAPPVAPTAAVDVVPPAEPVPAIEPTEVEIDALPPAVQIDDIVATPAEPMPDATVEEVIETGAEMAAVGDNPEPVTEAPRNPEPVMALEDVASIEPVAEDASPAIEPPAPTQPRVIADDDPETPDAFTAAVAEILPPTPMRRRSDGAAPSFHRRERAPLSTRAHLRAIAAVSALVLLLTLQLLLAQRDELAANPRWRPLVGAVCGVLRCNLPPWREPTAFTMLSRDVRPHPGAPGTLLINASFRNDARWSQPWPSLQLTLSDLDGRMVGARVFAAREYLGAAPTQKELAPGQSAAITLAVVEPAPNVVAFTFDFR